MHIPDLAQLSLPSFDSTPHLRGVGWLEPGHEYAKGPVDGAFITKLLDLLVNPWEPMVAMGRHDCGFCPWTGGPSTFRLRHVGGSSEVWVGISNLWLPTDGCLYVAPSLILHYIDAHEYLPPEEFRLAVMACPPMRSMDYLKAILKNGPKGLVQR